MLKFVYYISNMLKIPRKKNGKKRRDERVEEDIRVREYEMAAEMEKKKQKKKEIRQDKKKNEEKKK